MNSNQIKVTRLYTNPQDQHSYFQDISIPLQEESVIGILSKEIPAKMIQFRYTDGNYDLKLHNAPRKQYIIMMDGGVEITTSKGTKWLCSYY